MVCNVSRALLLLCYINIYDKYIIYIVDAPLMNFNGVRFGMAWFGLVWHGLVWIRPPIVRFYLNLLFISPKLYSES